jgi:protein-disulfide isomerase
MPKKSASKIMEDSKDNQSHNSGSRRTGAKVLSSALKKISLNKLMFLNTSRIMVTLLIIAAFLIGVLYTKVQYLERGQGLQAGTAINNGTTAQGNNPAGNAGTAGTVGTAAAPAPGAKVKVELGHFPVKGDNNAKVTIIEFADFRCPFCEQFFTQTEPQIFKDYVDTGKVKFAFRNYAFLGPASIVAADAAECANDQGKFWEFHDYLYKNQPPESDTTMYNTDTLTQAAVTLGMNDSDFRSCLDNKKDDALATKDMTDGQAAGVTGTPTFVINGTLLVGAQPYASIKAAIDQELAK